MALISFLSVSADKQKCLVCDKKFTKREKSSSFTLAESDGVSRSYIAINIYIDVYSKAKSSIFLNNTVRPKFKSAVTGRYKRTLLKYGEKRNAPEAGNN